MRGGSDGAALAGAYLDALRHQRRLSPATLTNYGHALQALFSLLKEGTLASLDPTDALAAPTRAASAADADRLRLNEMVSDAARPPASAQAPAAQAPLPETRVASLAGLAAAPQARARVVWHASRKEAVLVATGLTPAPPGKAYELWIIAKAAPVPAGVFQVDAQGRAVFRLPAGLSYEDVKTFAITVEPEAGTQAPTGPMVLAGAVS